MPVRPDERTPDALRPLTLTRGVLPYAEGSCQVDLGLTRVLVAASIEESVPNWRIGSGAGWVTAEYAMLPRATHTRTRRPTPSSPAGGRTQEIQRLVGRSLRAVADLTALGPRSIFIDCDVIVADGGTRTASIIGAAVALHDAGTRLVEAGRIPRHFMRELVAAISVGLKDGGVLVDLCYSEDSSADVDMNVVMTGSGLFVEVQGTAEKRPFDAQSLAAMTGAASTAIETIIARQKEALGLS